MTGRRGFDERGSSLVEFALVAPILCLLLFGIITGGVAISHKLDLSTAAREAARYAATLPANEYSTGTAWASAIAGEATNAAGGALTVSGATVCVALVQGSSSSTAVYSPGGSSYFYDEKYNGTSWVSTGTGAGPCYSDSGADGEARVQILVTRPDSIEAAFFQKSLTLQSDADARFEFTL